MQAAKEALGPMGTLVRKKLLEKFTPSFLDIINESYMHSVPKGSETHFKVVVISNNFQGMSHLQKHRSVQDCLKDEMKSGIHALSIVAKTDEEWAKNNTVQKSPSCMGGSKLDKKDSA